MNTKYLHVTYEKDCICLYLVIEYDDYQSMETILTFFTKPRVFSTKHAYIHILNLARIISLETGLDLIEEE